jgi:hypothetical protein
MTAGPVCLRSSRLLLGVGHVSSLWGLAKCCLRGPREMYGPRSYTNRACGVLIGFSPAGCTSIRIAATLGYEYRLFAAIIT